MGRKALVSMDQSLRVLHNWMAVNGIAPTIAEFRQALGVRSTRTALRYLRLLEEEGEIQRWRGARGLRLLKPIRTGMNTKPVPVLGAVPAGQLRIADEIYEGWVHLPTRVLKPSSAKFFLLRVIGDSMNKAHIGGKKIESGDLVLVKQQSVAAPNDVVVALLDDEATIKRFHRGPGYYVLKPESTNPRHQPIILERDFRILGVCRLVLKKAGELI